MLHCYFDFNWLHFLIKHIGFKTVVDKCGSVILSILFCVPSIPTDFYLDSL